MLLKLSIIFLASAAVCLAAYIYISKTRTRNRARGIRRFFGGLSLLSAITSAVLFVIFCRANNINFFNRLKSYDPVASYTKSLAENGADTAYAGLPDGIFSFDGSIYFKNGNGDMFEIVSQTVTAEDGTVTDSHSAKTVANGALYLGGKSTLRATVNDKKELVLDGYLRYSEYDGQRIEYNNKVIAKGVEYCSLTDNSLIYITESGDMYALGFNEYGQLGDTTTKNKDTPTYVQPDMKSCSVSETHLMTVDKFGTLYAVGDNSYSQLGNKTAVPTTEPITIMQGVKDVRVGNFYSVVLAVNGEVLTAGSNEKGQLGNSGEAFKAELVPILSGVERIEINGDTCAALTYGGELYVWGDNADFKAGYAGEAILPSPVKLLDNVLDFTLSENGVAVITRDRDILKSAQAGGFVPVLTFGAQIPDIYKDDAQSITPAVPDAA